jgi:serine/threonine-protein kinase
MSTGTGRSAGSDRNLLFGILALQMDFISRDALVRAMNAWVLDKAKPLGQVLLDQGALRPDTHALLEALVQKHLELHDHDAEKSLAAVSSIASVRQQLQQVADPEVQASLAVVARDRATEPDPHATVAPASVGTPTASGLRFRILRPHAKGGLGEVYVARDEELHREVALKEIQDQYADDTASRARFLLEAEITGGLEHPGVVPVYGLGQYADGRPFYAMRFIRGDNLGEAIARYHAAGAGRMDVGERAVEFRQLLRRFLDVCNAVAYAHSRGVLHRDLKPGNVMLGPYGETLVIDWGLAKSTGRADGAAGQSEGPLQPASASGSAPTVMGTAVGTPQYMSPEQAAGQLDRFGPATDVYSLGAILYCLLTGKAPFAKGEAGETLRLVQRGDFPSPRQVNRMVPRALDAICRKAMALRPEDRYPTSLKLAKEVERWLAYEPVQAYREPWMLRLNRWPRRYNTLAKAVPLLAFAFVSALGLLIGGILSSRKILQHEIDIAREIRDQTRLSESQSWAVTENCIRTLCEDPELKMAGVEPLRNKLLTQVQKDVQRVTENRVQEILPRRMENARVYVLLGYICRAQGDKTDAVRAYVQALELYEEEFAEHPNNWLVLPSISTTQVCLGELYLETNQLQEAEIAYRKALDSLQQIQDQFPHAIRRVFPEAWARAYHAIGTYYTKAGRVKEAEALLQEALKTQENELAHGQLQDNDNLNTSIYFSIG